MKIRESKRRSVLKGVSYRFIATLATVFVAYSITGEIASALHIGMADFFVKLGLYFVNDRIWSKVTWGIKVYDHQPPKKVSLRPKRTKKILYHDEYEFYS